MKFTNLVSKTIITARQIISIYFAIEILLAFGGSFPLILTVVTFSIPTPNVETNFLTKLRVCGVIVASDTRKVQNSRLGFYVRTRNQL